MKGATHTHEGKKLKKRTKKNSKQDYYFEGEGEGVPGRTERQKAKQKKKTQIAFLFFLPDSYNTDARTLLHIPFGLQQNSDF